MESLEIKEVHIPQTALTLTMANIMALASALQYSSERGKIEIGDTPKCLYLAMALGICLENMEALGKYNRAELIAITKDVAANINKAEGPTRKNKGG